VSEIVLSKIIKIWWFFLKLRSKMSRMFFRTWSSLAHLTLILLPHYLMKCKSRSLTVSNNAFLLGSACVGSKITGTTKSLKICYIFNIRCIYFKLSFISSLIVSTGAVYRYRSDGEKSGSLMTHFWSLTVATTKRCKAIAFTCLWG